jgi:hypothetical protein
MPALFTKISSAVISLSPAPTTDSSEISKIRHRCPWELRGEALGALAIHVDDGDRRAGGREYAAGRLTDPARPACHQSTAAIQAEGC